MTCELAWLDLLVVSNFLFSLFVSIFPLLWDLLLLVFSFDSFDFDLFLMTLLESYLLKDTSFYFIYYFFYGSPFYN